LEGVAVGLGEAVEAEELIRFWEGVVGGGGLLVLEVLFC